jgi:hypothetical protein
VALLPLSSYRFAVAQPPDANQILRDVQAKYASLQTYSDVGEVRNVVTTNSTGDAQPDIPTAFTIKLARVKMYGIAWASKVGSSNGKGSLWSDGGYIFIRVLGVKSEPKSMEEAFAMATGVSDGAASTIPSVFFNFSGYTIGTMRNAVVSGEEAIEGDDCYVVKSHAEEMDLTLWISKTTKLIRQRRLDRSGAVTPPAISDFDLKMALESMGEKATDEEVRKAQEMAASALKSTMGAIRSISVTETHRDIKIDLPLSPGDFREEPQAPPVPDGLK